MDTEMENEWFAVKKGVKFRLTYASNPILGYDWFILGNYDGVLQLLNSHYTPLSANGMGGGEKTFILSCLKEGETEFQLIYKKPWDQFAKRQVVCRVEVI